MPSPVEQFFDSVFGHLPTKDGAAYEQLAAIALHVLNSGTVQHDARIRGEFSKTIYQIDALQTANGKTTMAEAKDYSARAGKVGRGDLQKLGGALPDVSEVDSGAFFSATGYTAPARKYAASATQIAGKPIELFELRRSVVADEDGFIKQISVNINFLIPQVHKAKWEPVFTESGNQTLRVLNKSGAIPTNLVVGLGEFFDATGLAKLSVHDLTSNGYADPDPTSGVASGAFSLLGLFVKVESSLIEIESLKYEMPYETETRVITIDGGKAPKLTLADGTGKVLALINEHALRRYKFDSQGNLIAPVEAGSPPPAGGSHGA